VPDQTAEARIRDLERRLDLDPGSRLFVSLAEEYRKVGRIKDALSSLQKGLLAHPGYVAAQVALGRVYMEARQNTDAIATFTKVLQSDPGNLVAAKSLADIYHERGDNLEALKKFKLYRALSGDRKVDEIIAKIEPKVAPLPITPLKKIINTAEPPPPPPSFQDTQVARSRPTMSRVPVPSSELADPFDVTSLAFEPGEDSGAGKGAAQDDGGPFAVPTRDAVIAPPPKRERRTPVVEAAATSAQSEPPSAPAPPPPPAFFASPEPASAPAAFEPPPPAPPLEDEPPARAWPADDPEQTLSVRPGRASDAGDLFAPAASERAETDLPEPPALFITPAPPAEAGEVLPPSESRPRVSLEPREFPPPYAEEAATPAVPASAVPAAPFVAAHVEDVAAHMEGVAAHVEPVPAHAEPATPAVPAAPFVAAAMEPASTPEPEAGEPTGRALADLYYAQGHYAEALQIYDDLVTRHPFDDDLKRMRRDAEARLLPAASTPSAATADPGLERRLSRVRVLKTWLGRIQGSDHSAAFRAPGP